MTASQQPDAEHAPLTSPAAAGSGSTGHDKAVEWLAAILNDDTAGGACYPGDMWPTSADEPRHDARLILRRLRAALAAGDPDVAEALGIHPCGHIAIQRDCGGRDPGAVEFVRDDGGEWREA